MVVQIIEKCKNYTAALIRGFVDATQIRRFLAAWRISMIKLGNTVLLVQDLCKKFKGFEINNVSFTLDAGYIMGFIGRNGAGKTTILKLIQNVLVKNSGTVRVCGYDNIKEEIKAKNEIGFVADECPFVKTYTLLENAELFGKYYNDFDMAKFESYLNRFCLNGKQNILSLSKGMVSRFQLAFALSHNPRLLIMDEPNDGLDPIFRREFISLLQELIAEEKMGILFSTHITSDLDKIADYITLVNKGEIVLSEDKETLLEAHTIIKGKQELLLGLSPKKLIGTRKYPGGFEAMAAELGEEDLQYIASGKGMLQRPTLEDVMYYYSKGRIQNGKA